MGRSKRSEIGRDTATKPYATTTAAVTRRRSAGANVMEATTPKPPIATTTVAIPKFNPLDFLTYDLTPLPQYGENKAKAEARSFAMCSAAVRREMEALKVLKPNFWAHLYAIARRLEEQGYRHYNGHDIDKDTTHRTAFIVVCQNLMEDVDRDVSSDPAKGNTHDLWVSAFSAKFIKNVREMPNAYYSCLNTFQVDQTNGRLMITCDGRYTIDGHKEVARMLNGEVVDARYPGHCNKPCTYRYFAVPVLLFSELTK